MRQCFRLRRSMLCGLRLAIDVRVDELHASVTVEVSGFAGWRGVRVRISEAVDRESGTIRITRYVSLPLASETPNSCAGDGVSRFLVCRVRRRGLDSPPFWLYKSLRPVIGRNANRVNLVQVAPMRGFRGPLGFGTSESASVEQKKGVTYAETHSHGNRQRLVRCRGQDWSRAHGT